MIKIVNINNIDTEKINVNTLNIDRMPTIEVLKMINNEDKNVAFAVEKELDKVAEAVEIIYEKMLNGGRLIYCGCGTSGRLGVLDAAECPPTFGTDPELVKAIIAGGDAAFVKAIEGAEDNMALGESDLINLNFSANDVLVGIAASGRTPYVIGALNYAKKIGAKTVSLTCCPNSQISQFADVNIAPSPGAEVITGSTRLKSGTAQKLVLNMLSTTVMIKLGKVYGNLMVDVKATNQKLVSRTVSIVRQATDVTQEEAERVLKECDYSAKTAIVMILCNCSKEDAESKLQLSKGQIYEVINSQ